MDDIQPILTEIEVLLKIDHPNVVKLHEVLEDENNLYMVLEYMAGGTLRNRLTAHGGKVLTEEETYHILSPIVDAMSYCHSEGIVHRDLKVYFRVIVSQRISCTRAHSTIRQFLRFPTLALQGHL
jgi:serine/threonine protein kinase